MAWKRASRGLAIGITLVGTLVISGILTVPGVVTQATTPATHHRTNAWTTRDLTGNVRLDGQVPLSVSGGEAAIVGRHDPNAPLSLSFNLPLRDRAGLDRLIAQESRTHRYISRQQIYDRFVPSPAQYDALRGWLQSQGFTVTHVGADRLALSASAPTSVVERALHVTINDYQRGATSYQGYTVPNYGFFSNTAAPTVPARLGIQAITGLNTVDRFYTSVQLAQASRTGTLAPVDCAEPVDQAPLARQNPLCTEVRAGGYFPVDLRGLYDITGHGFDGTGQTIGFTLWTAPERQAAMTAFATGTGDQLITVDPSCTATGNSPTTPSSCSTQTVAADHLMSILENGNIDPGTNYGSNVETALDIQAAHGVATHVGMKYYASECSTNPPPGLGLSNAGCNGTDTGLLMAMEDAANDPTLHSVSNSWGFGGDAEWGATDPFLVISENILTLAAAAGTTFYFSTGDSGTYLSGYPTDSPHVVSVGGTSTYSTSSPGVWSTSITWNGAGSWCTNVFSRPVWQTGAGVNANAPCPGRVSPDVSAISDPNTGVRFISSTNGTGGTQAGQVGGTSLAAPVMNGLQAITQSFVNAQTYPGATPPLGFVAPMLYQLGNSANYNSYYRDVTCGNTANPTSGPDGDPALTGWDAATGWGDPDWFNLATGYAIALGATNLTQPASLARSFSWGCAKTPSNSTERAFSCPSTTVCYAVGGASGATPWYGKFLTGGAWGAVNTFFKSNDGGLTWFPSNSDMFSIACTSSATCMTVGAGGRERATTDGGNTWTDVATAPGNTKPLTQIQCPSSSICYAVGDRGNAMKSTDGGQTWSWLASTDGNPFYGLSCPTTSVCYATDIYAHVLKTSDGGANWTWQTTPVTTPGTGVPATGGPNPFAGLMSISCSDANTCAASGLYVVPNGAGAQYPSADPPIVTTTDGGSNWVRQTSNGGGTQSSSTTLSAATSVGATNIKVASVGNMFVNQQLTVDSAGVSPETVTITSIGTSGAGGTGVNITPALASAHASGVTVSVLQPNYLHGMYCLAGSTNCWAVGRNGRIVNTTDLTTWTVQPSGTTNLLNDVFCTSTTFCIAVGQNGTVDTYNGSTWTATTGNGGTGMLASVSCPAGNLVCYATGKQGTTLLTTTGGASWVTQAGGGTTAQMNGISCPSTSTCYTVGNAVSGAGTILKTSNGGQTWAPQTSGTASNLNNVACTSGNACVAVGAAGTARVTADGSTWGAGTTNTANALNWVSCAAANACVTVGAAGTARTSTDGGVTWATGTTGTTQALNAVACPTSTVCYAGGAATGGAATLLKSTDGGANWSPQTANTAASLNGVACVDASICFADGTLGATISTVDGGATWAQQGNPDSGPLSALNATSITLNGALCTSARCYVGTGAQGDILTTGLLTVTVNETQQYGTTPGVTTGLPPNDAAISYNPSGEAPHVTGTLTCSTTATNTSDPGSFPITNCSGLSDNGFTIVYDYADSSYTVTKADQTINFPAPPHRTWGDPDSAVTATASSGLPVTFGKVSGKCTVTSGGMVHFVQAGTCVVSAHQGGNIDYNPAPTVQQSVVMDKADQTIDFPQPPDKTLGDPDFQLSATSTSGLTVKFQRASGPCKVTRSGTVHLVAAGTCTVRAIQKGNKNYNAALQVVRSFDIN